MGKGTVGRYTVSHQTWTIAKRLPNPSNRGSHLYLEKLLRGKRCCPLHRSTTTRLRSHRRICLLPRDPKDNDPRSPLLSFPLFPRNQNASLLFSVNHDNCMLLGMQRRPWLPP